MLKLEENRFSKKFIYSVWLVMSFQAGYVNVGGFYTSGSFVSHVTGTSSQIGINSAKLDYAILLTFLTVLVAFIAGAAFAGRHIGRSLEEKKDPNYTLVLFTKSFFFGLVFLLSGFEWSSEYNVSAHTINIFILLQIFALCILLFYFEPRQFQSASNLD